MLDPRGGQLLLASLRPPDGFNFDCAVGTTYSLDLIALLTTPLAFAMFDWQDDQGRLAAGPGTPTADPLALLQSLRRCADRIHIYCQAGQIKVPAGNQPLLAHLEQSVIEVQPPVANGAKGKGERVFHPKVWAIRYTGESDAIRYRLLCLSRNLTFDRSWDTILTLEGELTSDRKPIENRSLSKFFDALPGLALRPTSLSNAAKEDTSKIAEELRVVQWELPEGVEDIRFWPTGLGIEDERKIFNRRIDRLLIVSPFLSESFLKDRAQIGKKQILVSRAECLQAMPPALLQGQWQCYTLDDGIDHAVHSEDSSEPSPSIQLTGLHAKVYIIDDGWNAAVLTGSANATHAAFSGNVEFLTELKGKKSNLGVDAAMTRGKDLSNLRSMLTEFVPPAEAAQPDAAIETADELIDAARRAICRLTMELTLTTGGELGNAYSSTLTSKQSLVLDDRVTVKCRPIMLTAGDAKTIHSRETLAIRFGPHAPESISSFVSFAIAATLEGITREAEFVVNLPLIGAPSDRKERLLRDLLRDPRTLLRFLLLLLSGDPEKLFEELRRMASASSQSSPGHSGDWLPLVEHMLRALHKSPDKLEQVNRLIEDLRKTPEGRSILPAELENVWDPIRRVLKSKRATAAGGAR